MADEKKTGNPEAVSVLDNLTKPQFVIEGEPGSAPAGPATNDQAKPTDKKEESPVPALAPGESEYDPLKDPAMKRFIKDGKLDTTALAKSYREAEKKMFSATAEAAEVKKKLIERRPEFDAKFPELKTLSNEEFFTKMTDGNPVGAIQAVVTSQTKEIVSAEIQKQFGDIIDVKKKAAELESQATNKNQIADLKLWYNDFKGKHTEITPEFEKKMQDLIKNDANFNKAVGDADDKLVIEYAHKVIKSDNVDDVIKNIQDELDKSISNKIINASVETGGILQKRESDRPAKEKTPEDEVGDDIVKAAGRGRLL